MIRSKQSILKIFTCLLITTLLFSACNDDSEDVKPKGTIEINFPSDWSVTEDPQQQIIIRIGQSPVEGSSDTFRENVNVAKEKAKNASLQEYYDAGIQSLQNIQDFNLISSKDTAINGMDSKKIIFTATITANNQTINAKYLDYIFYKGDHGYVLTCTATEQSFDQFKSTFQDIAASFKIN